VILPDNEPNRKRVAETIAAGGVIAFRTDTFYGLGVDPFNTQAVKRVLDLKGREEKPILLLISDRREVDRFIANQSETFELVARSFWPGPLTIVGEANANISIELTAGTGTIGLRLPDDDGLRVLVKLCGGALTATSANQSGSPPARTAAQVANYFPSGVDIILDGGETTAIAASTVLDVSRPIAQIVREGVISRARLEEVIRESTDYADYTD
jgi:L-threonylcarbamoyladenylate synthase